MGMNDRTCKWCGDYYLYKIGGNNKYCSKKCEIEADKAGKESSAQKASVKAAKGSFVENLTKNIEDT
jgi:hypothetical protein